MINTFLQENSELQIYVCENRSQYISKKNQQNIFILRLGKVNNLQTKKDSQLCYPVQYKVDCQ